jgi:hypothetical protein
MIKFNLLFAALALYGLIEPAAAQQGQAPAMETPNWVIMMEDPKVNFFEAVKAYDAYWLTHKKPTNEAETFETQSLDAKAAETLRAEEDKKRVEQLGPPLSGSALEQVEYLKYQSKRFEKWVIEVKPWVQDNGHILSYEERQAIWQRQQEEMRQQEKK